MSIKVRDNYFDNLRGFLIICVIIGNSLEYINPTDVNPHFFILCLYMFHMLLFTFISGYFCKKSKRTTKEKVIDTVRIYLFAQLFYYFFNLIILKKPNTNFELLRPNWTLWYLFALIFWYIISDYIHNYKRSFILSMLLSLILGFDGTVGSLASASRIFFFLPFFIAGLAFDKDAFLNKLKEYKIHIYALTGITFYILFLISDITTVELLFEYTNYTFYGDSSSYPLLIRAFHYIGGLIVCSFILIVCSSKKSLLTWIGKNSLILYVSHAAVIQILTIKPILKYSNIFETIISEAFILLIVIFITYLYTKLKSLLLRLKVNESQNVLQ